jgi:zinc transporter ZupT
MQVLLKLTWWMIAVTIAIVVVVIPIAVGAPTMTVFVPPTMTVIPAILAGLAQLGASVFGLLAFASMVLDRLMKAMVGFGNASLAIVLTGAQSRCAAEEQKSRQCRPGQRDFARAKNSRVKFYLHPVLLFF